MKILTTNYVIKVNFIINPIYKSALFLMEKENKLQNFIPLLVFFTLGRGNKAYFLGKITISKTNSRDTSMKTNSFPKKVFFNSIRNPKITNRMLYRLVFEWPQTWDR